MFNPINFNDLYRFSTSIGIFLIALSFTVPWFLISLDNGIFLSAEQIANLPPESYEIYRQKEHLIDIAIRFVLPVLFVVFITLGITLITVGLVKWRMKQVIIDENERLEHLLKKDDHRKLNEQENAQRVENQVLVNEELEPQNEVKDDETIQLNEKGGTEDQEELHGKVSTLKENLIYQENLLKEKLLEYEPYHHEVLSQVKLLNKYAVDFYLKSNFYNKYGDLFIELKYFQKNFNFNAITETVRNLMRLRNDLSETKKGTSTFIILVVYNDREINADKISRFHESLEEYTKQFKRYGLKLFFMSEDEFKIFDVSTILKLA